VRRRASTAAPRHAVDGEVLGVVGEGDVVVAASRGASDDLQHAVGAVAGEVGVDVQVAAEIAAPNQCW